MYTDGMTDTLDKRKLLSVLEDRIAALHPRTAAGARVLSDLVREINNGAYDTLAPVPLGFEALAENPQVMQLRSYRVGDTDGPSQPVPEVFVDMLIGGQTPVHELVEQLPVGEVAAARTVLWRRRHEAEQQVGQFEKLLVVFTEALEETLRADEPQPDQSDEARERPKRRIGESESAYAIRTAAGL